MPGYDILLNPERKEELENEIGSINRQMEGAFKRMNITDPEVNNLMLGALWFSVYPCREFIVSVQSPKSMDTWLREISSCSCLTFPPGPA